MVEELPEGLRRLWAPEGTDRRAPRPGLSLSRIVEAAVGMADEQGLDAVSMSRLARSLGYTTMSLYRYVSTKDELLLLMHDTVWQVPTVLDDPSDEWRPALVLWCREQRTILHRHPWLERIRVTERAGTPSQLTWMDRGLRALSGVPLTEYEKGQVLLLLNGFLFWDARLAADLREALRGEDRPVPEAITAVSDMIKALATPDRFPALRRAVEGGMFDLPQDWQDPGAGADADFLFGLDRILDGVQDLIERRTPAPAG
jgi:AcrR family transcriptional regulator